MGIQNSFTSDGDSAILRPNGNDFMVWAVIPDGGIDLATSFDDGVTWKIAAQYTISDEMPRVVDVESHSDKFAVKLTRTGHVATAVPYYLGFD